ncbi:hypothetical protein HDF15_004071 [Granulicella mallensis]|uniref:Transposase IS200-like domain-containing protein n=1 Tax=Granulicella mallensis TaxID=940614 RepID=A0A7W8EBG4_9BACT|nr:hypothetical protein [Granulicella mallensis]
MRPKREVATNNGQTYFVTSNTAQRKPFFRHARWAELLIETFYGYRPERFLIHGFVVMPDHFHFLMTPQETLERAEDHAYCSANRRFELDAFPQGLKPQVVGAVGGAAKAAPFQSAVGQSTAAQSAAAGVFSKQSKQIGGGVEAPSLQSSTIFLRN